MQDLSLNKGEEHKNKREKERKRERKQEALENARLCDYQLNNENCLNIAGIPKLNRQAKKNGEEDKSETTNHIGKVNRIHPYQQHSNGHPPQNKKIQKTPQPSLAHPLVKHYHSFCEFIRTTRTSHLHPTSLPPPPPTSLHCSHTFLEWLHGVARHWDDDALQSLREPPSVSPCSH